MPVGGGANKLFLRVDRADHSRVIPKGTALTAAAEAAATAITAPAPSDAALLLKNDVSVGALVETSGFKYDDNGIGTITYGHTKMDQEILDFLEFAASKELTAGGSDVEEIFSEDGTKAGGANASGGAVYLLIDQGPTGADGILTDMCIVGVKKSSGSKDYKKATYVRPTLECTQVACNKTGGYAIPQSAFDATIWGTITAGDRTIGKDKYVKTMFLPAHT